MYTILQLHIAKKWSQQPIKFAMLGKKCMGLVIPKEREGERERAKVAKIPNSNKRLLVTKPFNTKYHYRPVATLGSHIFAKCFKEICMSNDCVQ